MKKVLFTAAALFAFGFANAQEETTDASAFGFTKGDMFVEGNLGFDSNKSTDSDASGDFYEEKTSKFDFNPKFGYFVTEKLAVGVELNLNSMKNTETDLNPTFVDERKSNSFGAGVFARYYFLDLGQRFKTYAEAGLGFESGKTERSLTGAPALVTDNEFSGINAGFTLGMQYFVTPKMAINFGLADVLSFRATKYEDNLAPDEETTVSEFNGNLNVFNNFFSTARFGVTYKF